MYLLPMVKFLGLEGAKIKKKQGGSRTTSVA